MDTTIVILIIIVGVLVIVDSFYIYRSNRKLKQLIVVHEKNKIDDKFILDHIVHTHTSLNVVYTSIAMVTFILAFLGLNAYNNLEIVMKKNLEIKGETISKSVIDSTKEKVKDILAINLDTLIQKRNTILEIAADVQRQKRKFDNIVSRRTTDSLNIEIANIRYNIDGMMRNTNRHLSQLQKTATGIVADQKNKVEKMQEIEDRVSTIADSIFKKR